MKQLSRKEKERILSRLYWDMDLGLSDIYSFLNGETNSPETPNEINFYCRLLSSCDWYTLLKLASLGRIKEMLTDTVIGRIYPKDLKDRFLYARQVLSK